MPALFCASSQIKPSLNAPLAYDAHLAKCATLLCIWATWGVPGLRGVYLGYMGYLGFKTL